MSIWKKMLLSIGAIYTVVIILLFITTQGFLLNKFVELEKQTTQQNVLRFLDALHNDLASLDNVADDWSTRDDTCQFITNHNPGYIQSNLTDQIFKNLQLNLIVFLDTSGQIFHSKVFNLETGKEITDSSIPNWVIANLKFLTSTDPNHIRAGIILLPQGPLMVAANPIMTRQVPGSSRGTLILGRFLNNGTLQKLAKLTHLSIKINDYFEFHNNPHTGPISPTQENPILTSTFNAKQITGYALINDISGKPALVASIQLPRTIYQQGQTSIYYFDLAIIGIGFLLTFLIWALVKKIVLKRLALLNSSIGSIAESSDLSIRIPFTGNDELSNFTGVINHMMDNLERFHNQLEESNQQLLDIIEFLPDATFVIDRSQRVVAWNRAIEKMTGMPKNTMIGKGEYAYAIPFYGRPQPLLIDLVNADLNTIRRHYENTDKKGAVLFAEVFVPTMNNRAGAYLWVTASPLINKKGQQVGAIESIRDISTRKRTEDQLKYLSLHDPLTGLYNRTYFEEEIRRLDDGVDTVGIIICDVDGLKLVNDSLGHSIGDKLLRDAAAVIKGAFRSGDMVARVGGDEYAILLPESDGVALELAGRRIKEGVSQYNQTNPELPLSISVGWSLRSDTPVSLKNIFEEADNNMYREKLLRSKSARSAIVQTLMKTLGARDFLTEGHADRLRELVMDLSKKLGFSDRKMYDLSLLAQFHDIGKVGIPDNILFKQGPLDSEEQLTMRRHTEIGYTIAQSAQELMPIAEWILMHHEWWNGNGYPRGLKGEEIPLECRILTIVDAYDAMTSDRPYRKALTQQVATAELRKCAGTQFDPILVEEFIKMIESPREEAQ